MTAGDEAEARIRELAAGRGVDVVLDFVGAHPTLELAVKIVRRFGDLTIVGLGGGGAAGRFLLRPVLGTHPDDVLGQPPGTGRGDRPGRTRAAEADRGDVCAEGCGDGVPRPRGRSGGGWRGHRPVKHASSGSAAHGRRPGRGCAGAAGRLRRPCPPVPSGTPVRLDDLGSQCPPRASALARRKQAAGERKGGSSRAPAGGRQDRDLGVRPPSGSARRLGAVTRHRRRRCQGKASRTRSWVTLLGHPRKPSCSVTVIWFRVAPRLGGHAAHARP